LGYWSGVTDEAGKGYGFWSGIGSCLTYLGILVLAYRKLNCHQDGCHRIGLHKVDGTPYIVCTKHHPAIPAGPVTAEHIHAAHHAHLRRRREEQ
jgi:hypothetical protein